MAEKKNYRLKGHETFIIREGWLNKGLAAVNANPRVFKENSGADALGVGTNMARSIRFWLKAAGLTTEDKGGIFLSETGNIIFENDPYFEDYFTLWTVHYNIAENRELATSWNLFFNNFENIEFTRENLAAFIKSEIKKIWNEDDISERSVNDDVNALINMYLKTGNPDSDPEDKKVSPFAEFGLLKRNVGKIQRCRPAYQTLNEYVILYGICPELEKTSGISIDSILTGDNMPGKILNLSRSMLNEYLDKLAYDGSIYINRTAGLDMVYGKEPLTRSQVLSGYYEKNRQGE